MSKEIFELVKLFTVQYLQQIEGFQGFSRESVVIISNYILALVSHMARSVKELVGEVQNRKLPNCLHLLFVCSEIRNIIHITPFATYLHRKNKKSKKKQLNIHIRKDLFSEKLKWGEKQETCYHNIKKVPEQYMIGEEIEKTYNKVYWPETVPLFAPVEEWVQKPHPFTYTNQSQLIRNKVNSEMPDQSKRAQEEHIRRSLSSFPRSQAKQTTFEPPRKCFSLRKNPYKISDFI